ncbi:hypothetical protein BD769DRAFT_1457253, partial [Suillus cothurnatus]
ACTPGLWVHVNAGAGTQDEGVLEIVGGSQEEGDVEVAGGRKAAHISQYLYMIVTPFISDYLSSYLSLCPSPGDTVL